jgi:hypothetical protein
MISCPICQSENIKLNGHIHNGKQNHLCKNCNRQFVLAPEKKVITKRDKDLIDRLLLEKISLAGIARTMDVSQVWLQEHISQVYASCPDNLCAELPDQASMNTYLEDKFDEYVYQITPLKKMLNALSVQIHGCILRHLSKS